MDVTFFWLRQLKKKHGLIYSFILIIWTNGHDSNI